MKRNGVSCILLVVQICGITTLIAVMAWLYSSVPWHPFPIAYDALWHPLRDHSQSDIYQVLNVSDGDTIAVRSLNTGKPASIRFACIDAPEVAHDGQPGQPLGEESKANLKRLLDQAGGRVIVQAVDRDGYGRIVGEVFVAAPTPQQPEQERFLNYEQVAAGMAYVYSRYVKECSNGDSLSRGEAEAKRLRKGVWQNPNAIKPWDYRKLKR